MGKFIVYEVWTSARVVDAKNEREAYEAGEPKPRTDLNLCNWHVVPVTGPVVSEEREQEIRMTLDKA